MTETGRTRDRYDDPPIIPASPAVGAPVITPGFVGEDPRHGSADEVAAEETDREAPEDDDRLLTPDSPEFDHSLRRGKRE
jgi:hypothetical protein